MTLDEAILFPCGLNEKRRRCTCKTRAKADRKSMLNVKQRNRLRAIRSYLYEQTNFIHEILMCVCFGDCLLPATLHCLL